MQVVRVLKDLAKSGGNMNKRQAKVEALSACAEVLFGFRDSDFAIEGSDKDREKLMKAIDEIALRLWDRSMDLREHT